MKKNLYDICLKTVRIAKLYFGVKYRAFSCREKISKCSRIPMEEKAMKRTQKNFHRNILICVYGFFFVCILVGIIVWAIYIRKTSKRIR